MCFLRVDRCGTAYRMHQLNRISCTFMHPHEKNENRIGDLNVKQPYGYPCAVYRVRTSSDMLVLDTHAFLSTLIQWQ